MTQPRPDTQLVALGRLVENLAHKWPIAAAHYRNELSICDGWPARGDTDRVQATAELTQVERQASQRIELEADWWQLCDDRRFIQETVANMMERLDHIVGIRVEVPRCTGGTGREGALDWGNPTCDKVPSRGGRPAQLCDACAQRERRWRIEHQLPTRDEEAAA